MSTTPGYCELCGTHNYKHTENCPADKPPKMKLGKTQRALLEDLRTEPWTHLTNRQQCSVHVVRVACALAARGLVILTRNGDKVVRIEIKESI